MPIEFHEPSDEKRFSEVPKETTEGIKQFCDYLEQVCRIAGCESRVKIRENSATVLVKLPGAQTNTPMQGWAGGSELISTMAARVARTPRISAINDFLMLARGQIENDIPKA